MMACYHFWCLFLSEIKMSKKQSILTRGKMMVNIAKFCDKDNPDGKIKDSALTLVNENECLRKKIAELEKQLVDQSASLSRNEDHVAAVSTNAGLNPEEEFDVNAVHSFRKTPSEKVIASKYMRVETRGKLHLKPASMLLSLRQIELIKLILKHREKAGVPQSNPYVFGRKNGCFKAYISLKEVAYASDAKHPDLLIGTLLRKHIATTAQALNFTENDMTNLAAFLGHDIKTHRKFYRLPSEAIHLAKISRLLMAMDDGTINEFHGKSLEEINVNIEVGCDAESENEPNVSEKEPNESEKCTEVGGKVIEEIDDSEMIALDDSKEEDSQVNEIHVKHNDNVPSKSRKNKMIPQKRNDLSSLERTPPRKKHASKITWTTPERQTARRIFKKYINSKDSTLPTPLECREAIKKHKELYGRSINQVKGWVFSERKRQMRN